MGRDESQTTLWPPLGWPQFEEITKVRGQSQHKDILAARVYGMLYRVFSDPLDSIDQQYAYHRVSIHHWEYSIQNESAEYPILSFCLSDRHDLSLPKHHFISDIKSMGRPLESTPKVVNRTVMAALFFLKQISAGQAPDYDRVLRLYRLHPLQTRLQDMKRFADKELPLPVKDKKESSRF